MRKLVILWTLGSLLMAAVTWWRRHPRVGAAWVNRVLDPWLVERGLLDRTNGEIGLLEHVGRTSGTVRRTPVHPVATETGFRIIVPLGAESQWARNVIAAGHCRLQIADTMYELDEPLLVEPSSVAGVPALARGVMGWLGFRYLELRRFAATPVPVPDVEPETRLDGEVVAPV